MPTTGNTVKVYLDDDQLTRLNELAAQLQLKKSDLIRRLIMGYRLPDPTDFVAHQGIRDLLKVNADLARLGNLLKLVIDEAPDHELIARAEALIADIETTKAVLKAGACDIRELVRPRRRHSGETA